MKSYTNSRITYLIDEHIHNARDRRIMKLHYVDGMSADAISRVDCNRKDVPPESESVPTLPAYSYAAPPEQVETIIDYQSDMEFSAVIDGRRADDVWLVMEELMEVLRRTSKPLYNATIRKIQD